jgi:hypothetical protein
MVRGMKHITAVLLLLVMAGCAHHTRRAPELSARKAPAPRPAERNVFQKTGDIAWDVVSAPVRLIAPGKKPAAKKQEPETYEPAEAIIMMPPETTEAAPAATQPR